MIFILNELNINVWHGRISATSDYNYTKVPRVPTIYSQSSRALKLLVMTKVNLLFMQCEIFCYFWLMSFCLYLNIYNFLIYILLISWYSFSQPPFIAIFFDCVYFIIHMKLFVHIYTHHTMENFHKPYLAWIIY